MDTTTLVGPINVLVIGGGGRESAIMRALLRSPKVARGFIAPGNAGTYRMDHCENLSINLNDEKAGQRLLDAIVDHNVSLTVFGPEAPLIAGLAELLRAHGHHAVGHDVAVALLEGDKAFSYRLMDESGIPTARSVIATSYAEAMTAIDNATLPIVVKAKGQALGKGVIICQTREEARDVCVRFMLNKEFGNEGTTVLIQEHLTGVERSLILAIDESGYQLLLSAQDHKRAYDGDEGPNTGGMGAYAPTDGEWIPEVIEKIVEPLHKQIKTLKGKCRGFIYIGLMLTADGPKVLEFNARLGDPEAECILALLESDFAELCWALATGTMSSLAPLKWKKKVALTVVMASGGYPIKYNKGYPIELPDNEIDGVIIDHAGTKLNEAGQVVTDGGRVIAVTGIGDDLNEARRSAYYGVGQINFEEEFHRRDMPVLAS